MGPITGLATIATTLLVVMVVGTLAVVGLTVAFVVPALRETRTDRLTPAGQHPELLPAPRRRPLTRGPRTTTASDAGRGPATR